MEDELVVIGFGCLYLTSFFDKAFAISLTDFPDDFALIGFVDEVIQFAALSYLASSGFVDDSQSSLICMERI